MNPPPWKDAVSETSNAHELETVEPVAPVKVEETRMLGCTQEACCMGGRDEDREPMLEGTGVLLWDRGGGEGACGKEGPSSCTSGV